MSVASPEEQLAKLEASIVELISKDAVRIPPYPAVAMKVAKLVREENFGMDELTRLVSSDQRMSADVLRVAASAAYGRGGAVSSVQAAVARVGAKEVASVALASGLGPAASAPGALSTIKRQIWQESVTSALLCQKLGEARHQSGSEAFTAGLLHDFGRIVVAQSLEQLLGDSLLSVPAETWLTLIDRFHVEVGLVVGIRWNLSQMLCDVFLLHHSGPIEAAENPQILDAVMAVDELLAVASGVASLTEAHLAVIDRLRSPAERELMVRTYLQCPELIASFEVGDPKPETKTAVDPPVRRDLKPVSFKVVARAHEVYQAVEIGPTALMVEGTVALPLNRVVPLELETPNGPLKIWANPVTCNSAEGRQRLEMRPFALTGPAFEAWCALLKAIPAAAAPA